MLLIHLSKMKNIWIIFFIFQLYFKHNLFKLRPSFLVETSCSLETRCTFGWLWYWFCINRTIIHFVIESFGSRACRLLKRIAWTNLFNVYVLLFLSKLNKYYDETTNKISNLFACRTFWWILFVLYYLYLRDIRLMI